MGKTIADESLRPGAVTEDDVDVDDDDDDDASVTFAALVEDFTGAFVLVSVGTSLF